MGFSSEPAFLAMHAVCLKGSADTEVIAAATGEPVGWVAETVERLAEDDLVRRLKSTRLHGWRLTPAGAERHVADLAFDIKYAACRETVAKAYETFVALVRPFEEACTAWRLCPDRSGQLQTNDHSDVAYDGRVKDLLGEVHESVVPAVERLSIAYDRFGQYPIRFHRVLARLEDGDLEALARPLGAGSPRDSYKDVWMELHQDLLLTLGRRRPAHDGGVALRTQRALNRRSAAPAGR